MTLAIPSGKYWYSLHLFNLALEALTKGIHPTESYFNPHCNDSTQTFSSWIHRALPLTSSIVFLSAGLNTFLISGRKVEPHSHCSYSQLGSAGHENEDTPCTASRVHTPDRASSACTLPPDSVKVNAYSWLRKLWCIDHVEEEANIFLESFFFAQLNCRRKNSELHVLLHPLWCSSFLLSVYLCLCGCI